MSIDYGHLHRQVTEMEQGVAATTTYSWADLAQEVLRMREALHDLSGVWEAVSIDPARTPMEQELAAAVVNHIDQILGDHDD